MESDELGEGHASARQEAPSQEVSTRTPSGELENEPPAGPIKGPSDLLIPRAATIWLMGATWLFASRGGTLQGAQALTFALLGLDAPGRTRATYLISNTVSPVLVWTVEANRGSPAPEERRALHGLAMLAVSLSGIERVAPVCYLYSMATWDPVSSSGDLTQAVPQEEAGAVLPATLLGYVLPAALVSLMPLTATGVSLSPFSTQRCAVLAFHVAPFTVPAWTSLISMVTRLIKRKKAGKGGPKGKGTPKDKKPYRAQDALEALHSLKSAYAVAFAIQAAQHLFTIARGIIQAPPGKRSVAAVLRNLLACPGIPGQQYSSIALYSAATLGFGLCTVWELRRRGMVSGGDARRSAAGVLAGQVLFGPGATYAGLWWWREGVLARARRRA